MPLEKLNRLLKLLKITVQLLTLYNMYKQMKNNNRRWWVRPINLERNYLGYFETSFMKMKEIDPEQFFIHTRMKRITYDLFLSLMKDSLTKRSIRTPINFECRIAITLSFLSQGVSVQFLAWSFKVGKTTIRNIILDTCEIIWQLLSPIYVARPTESDYIQIGKNFEQRWNMPHCLGAIDGKHIQIKAPPKSGSQFFNYKKCFSIVLLAACDGDYTFTEIAVGAYGSQSDGGIFQESTFGKELISKKLPIPKPNTLPNSDRVFPHYFVADAAFPLKENIMRPYPGKKLPDDKDIFNYRLSRARRIIENSFGILVSRWRVLQNNLNMFPENAEKIVLATVVLHNFIKLNDTQNSYISSNYVDWEDEDYIIHEGEWRQNTTVLNAYRPRSHNASRDAFILRDELKEYFMEEGAVPFQFNRRH